MTTKKTAAALFLEGIKHTDEARTWAAIAQTDHAKESYRAAISAYSQALTCSTNFFQKLVIRYFISTAQKALNKLVV